MRNIIVTTMLLTVWLSGCSQERQTDEPPKPDWVKVATSSDRDQIYYVDRNSIVTTGDVRQYHERSEYVNNPQGWMKSASLSEANCVTGEHRVMRTTVNFDDGRNATDSNPLDFEKVLPGSMVEKAHAFVCGK
jgi:hypothetical protein